MLAHASTAMDEPLRNEMGDKTQEVLQRGKEELEALKTCIFNVRKKTTMLNAGLSSVPECRERSSPGDDLDAYETETGAWGRTATWVVQSNATQEPVGVKSRDSNKNCESLANANEEEDPAERDVASQDIQDRLRAVVEREAAALVGKAAAENQLSQLADQIMVLEKEIAQKDLELKLQMAHKKETEAMLICEKQKSEDLERRFGSLEREQNKKKMIFQELLDSKAENESLALRLKLNESSRLAMERALDTAQENVSKMQNEVQGLRIGASENNRLELKKASTECHALQDGIISIAQKLMGRLEEVPQAIQCALGGMSSILLNLETRKGVDTQDDAQELMQLIEQALVGVLDEIRALQADNYQRKAELRKINSANEKAMATLREQEEESSRSTRVHAAEMSNALEDTHRLKMNMEQMHIQANKKDAELIELNRKVKEISKLKEESDDIRAGLETQLCLEKLEVQKALQIQPEVSDFKCQIRALESKLKKAQEESEAMQDTLQIKESRIRELRSSLVVAAKTSMEDMKGRLWRALEDKESALKNAEAACIEKDSIMIELSNVKGKHADCREQYNHEIATIKEINKCLLDTIESLLNELKSGILATKRKVASTFEKFHCLCNKHIDSGSVLIQLSNGIDIIDQWKSEVPNPDLHIKVTESQVMTMASGSLSWCIDSLMSELSSTINICQHDSRAYKDLQLKCNAAASELQKCIVSVNLHKDADETTKNPNCLSTGNGTPQVDGIGLQISQPLEHNFCGVVASANNHIKNMNQMLSKRDAHISKLKGRIDVLQCNMEESNTKNELLQREITAGKAQVNNMQNKIQDMHIVSKRHAQALEKMMKKEIRKAKHEKKEATLMLDDVRKESESKIAFEINEHKENLEAFKRILNQYETKIDGISKTLSTSTELKQDAQLKLEEAQQRLHASLLETKRLEKTVLMLEAANVNVEAELKKTEGKLKELETNMFPGKLTLSIYQAQLSVVRKKRRALFLKVYQQKMSCKHHERRSEKLSNQLRLAKKEVQILRDNQQEELQEMEKSNSKARRMEMLVSKLEERRFSSEKENRILQDKLINMHDIINAHEVEAHNQHVLHEQMAASQADLEDQLYASSKRIQELSAKLGDAKEQLQKMVNVIGSLQAEHESELRRASSTLDGKDESEDSRLDETNTKVQELLSRLEKMEADVQQSVHENTKVVNSEERTFSIPRSRTEEIGCQTLEEPSKTQKDKSVSCSSDNLCSLSSSKAGSVENDQKSFRMQELRQALMRITNEKACTSKSLDAMTQRAVTLTNNIDSLSRELAEANQRFQNMEAELWRMQDIKSWPRLEYVLSENSLVETIFHTRFEQQQEGPTLGIKSLIGRVTDTLASVTSSLFLERKETENSVKEYHKLLQNREDETDEIFCIFDKRISKGFKRLEILAVQFEEIQKSMKNQDESKQAEMEAELNRFTEKCSQLLGQVENLQTMLKKTEASRSSASKNHKIAVEECEKLSRDLSEIQKKLEAAQHLHEKDISRISYLETQVSNLQEATEKESKKIYKLQELCDRLKARLVDSIAIADDKTEQAFHLKKALNTALEKIKYLHSHPESNKNEV